MHDPRVGRFFTVDPLYRDFPYWSPYVFSGNQVMHTVELEGLETENNLNENEVTIQEDFAVIHKQGKSGDWLGTQSGYLIFQSSDIQAQNFAEATESQYVDNKSSRDLDCRVKVCKNSNLGNEIFRQLKEQHGLVEDDLSRGELIQLLSIDWKNGEDRSDLFHYSYSNYNLAGLAVPVTIPLVYAEAITVVLPGAYAGTNELYIDVTAVAKKQVDEFAHKRKKQSTGSKKKTAPKHEHGEQHGGKKGKNRNQRRGNKNKKYKSPPNPNKKK